MLCDDDDVNCCCCLVVNILFSNACKVPPPPLVVQVTSFEYRSRIGRNEKARNVDGNYSNVCRFEAQNMLLVIPYVKYFFLYLMLIVKG